MRRYFFLSVVCMAVVFSLPAIAGDALPLSLKDAVSLALSDGSEVELAGLEAKAARAKSHEALSALLPHVEAKYSQSNNVVNLKAYGFSVPGQDPIVGPFNVYDARIEAALRVFDLSAIDRYRAAKVEATGSDFKRMALENEAIATVAMLYIACLKGDSEVKEEARTLKLFEDVKATTEREMALGISTLLDVHRTEFKRSTQEQILLQAKENREAARLALLRATGLPFIQALTLTQSFDELKGPLPAMEEALALAQKNRPELKMMAATQKGARLGLASAKAELLPTVSAQFVGGYNGDQIDDLAWNRSISGVISLPIVNGGQTFAQIESAKIAAKRAQLEEREAGRKIEEEVRNAHLAYETSLEHLKAAEENLYLAKEELTLSLDRFKNGIATSLEVDHAETSLAEAVHTKVKALSIRGNAWIALQKATGEIRIVKGSSSHE